MPPFLRFKPTAPAVWVLVSLSCLALASPAHAAVDMFIKITTLDGETTDRTFGPQKASDVLAFSWGASNVPGGRASFNDFSWTQYLDTSVPDFFLGLADGTHFDKATFSVRHAGISPFVFLQMEFEDVVLTSLSMGGSGGEDRLTTNQTLQPLSKITMTYTPQQRDGRAGTPKVASWTLNNGVVNSFAGDRQALFGLFLAGPEALDLTGLPVAVNLPVPEPQSALLLGLGLGGLAWLRRRQRSAAPSALPV